MADPVYPIYPAQEETAAVQKYLADKQAYEAIAANLPAIEEKIARQQQIAKNGYSIQPPTLLESVSGFYIPRRVYSSQAQQQAILSIRDLESQKAAIQNAQQNAQRPDLSVVSRAAFPAELPPGVESILSTEAKPEQQPPPSQAEKQSTPTPESQAQPTTTTSPAPAPEKPQYDPFAEFRKYEKDRKAFFNIAFREVSKVPIQYQDEALKLVEKEWENIGTSLPRSTLMPLKHPVTGEILKDQALTADGRIVELKAPPAEKALTESQSKAVQFATAMKEADQQVTDLLKRSNYDPTNPLNTLPMFETLKSQDRKLYEGTVRDFAVAMLRRTSGAHVTPQEFKITEETYFPQSGDSEAVLKAKERRRKRDVASVYADVPESARGEIFPQNQQQQSAPGGVVDVVKIPGIGLRRQ